MPEAAGAERGEARQLAVDVWYPAIPSANSAPYIRAALFRDEQAAALMRPYLGTAFELIEAGSIETHAAEGAGFASNLERRPLLLFSHGGGEMKETYSAQLADLASHGYVVAAVAHTYDARVTDVPGEPPALYDPRRWPEMAASSVEGVPVAQQANPAKLAGWAKDLSRVLDALGQEDSANRFPFAGHLDLGRVGAFGHSFGGSAAATACQQDARFAACLDQDGLSSRTPYYLTPDGWGMDQAFMLMVRATPASLPSPEELTAMDMSLEQSRELSRRLDERQLATLRNTGRGSYRVTLASAATTHDDFGDLPILQSVGAQAQAKAAVMATIRSYTRRFFDCYLLGATPRGLTLRAPSGVVEAVEYFPPAGAGERTPRRR